MVLQWMKIMWITSGISAVSAVCGRDPPMYLGQFQLLQMCAHLGLGSNNGALQEQQWLHMFDKFTNTY